MRAQGKADFAVMGECGEEIGVIIGRHRAAMGGVGREIGHQLFCFAARFLVVKLTTAFFARRGGEVLGQRDMIGQMIGNRARAFGFGLRQQRGEPMGPRDRAVVFFLTLRPFQNGFGGRIGKPSAQGFQL